MSARQDIEKAAAAWVLLKAEGLSREEQARFNAWLNTDPEHRLAVWRLEYGWARAERLSALRNPETLAEVMTEHKARSGIGRGRLIAIAASLIFVIGLGALAWPRATIFETDVGEHQQLTLEDGSRLDLNTRTRLRTAMSDDLREAWLDQGEAYFSIVHESDRPFVLHMGQRSVRVLGTRFVARRHGDRISVTVQEGRVRVDDPANRSETPMILTAGDVVSTEGSSLLRHRQSPDGIDADLAWRGGQLVFDQVSLGEAAAEFNRYNRTQLQVADASTRTIRIGGTFEANNVDAFVRLLDRAYGLRIERDGEVITISE